MKYVFISNQTCQSRPTIVDINYNEPPYYRFCVDVNKCDGVQQKSYVRIQFH